MTTKHTPGPWLMENPKRADKRLGIFPGESLSELAWVDYDDVDHKEAEANARLITAAPDLLAALRVLVGEMEIEGYDTSGMSQAYAAIAKAEGR